MSRQAVIQSHLEALMQQVLEVEELRVSDQGYVNVRSEKASYTVRLRPNRTEPHIEVYSVVVTGLDKDPGLYEALNEINSRLSHCRAFLEDDQIVIAGELVGASADVAGLDCLCDEVSNAADHHGPKIVEVFGGTLDKED